MKAGRPGTSIPSQKTVSRDIQLAFNNCQLRIDKILRVHVSISVSHRRSLKRLCRSTPAEFISQWMPGLLPTTGQSLRGLSTSMTPDTFWHFCSMSLRSLRYVITSSTFRSLFNLLISVTYWESPCNDLSGHVNYPWARNQGILIMFFVPMMTCLT
jgi:hypothetical protein